MTSNICEGSARPSRATSRCGRRVGVRKLILAPPRGDREGADNLREVVCFLKICSEQQNDELQEIARSGERSVLVWMLPLKLVMMVELDEPDTHHSFSRSTGPFLKADSEWTPELPVQGLLMFSVRAAVSAEACVAGEGQADLQRTAGLRTETCMSDLCQPAERLRGRRRRHRGYGNPRLLLFLGK